MKNNMFASHGAVRSSAALLCLSISASLYGQTGSGTTNRVTKWTSSTTLGNSAITESSGNVGIGTTSPQDVLHIGNGNIRIDHSSGDPVLLLNTPGKRTFSFGVHSSTAGNGVFYIADLGTSPTSTGTRRFTISNTGNVGIGTNVPTQRLTVAGTVQSTTGGFLFPDGTLQTTAAGGGAANVQHDGSLMGNGTGGSLLGVALPLILTGSANGIVTGHDTSGGYGVYGTSVSGFGVYGVSSIGVAGNSSNNIGVYGSGPYAGVSSYGGTYGVLSTAYNTSGSAYGVYATGYDGVYAQSNRAGGNGIVAVANNGSTNDYAIWGQSSSGYAGVFSGNVSIGGTLTKSAGTFRIDHPLDPENKYLSHSFVESPDMMNIYNGIVDLDGSGQALVALPDYFSALNKDFRYQLTAMGAPGPNLYVAQEIAGNEFRIAGGKPGMRVSWQVTGVRQDAYANAHRTPVEEDKPEKERGTYLHPELFAQPQEKGMEWVRHPEMMQHLKQMNSVQQGQRLPLQ